MMLNELRGLQETRVATREESGVLGFPSRRGLTPRGSLECPQRRVVWMWFGALPGAFGLGRAHPPSPGFSQAQV